MMRYQEALDIAYQLIADKGRGVQWGIYKRFRYDISEDAKHLAIKLLDDPNNVVDDIDNPGNKISLAEALRKAIGTELKCKIHRDYLYRIIALALDDDDMGNHITLQLLLILKSYRMKTLGMNY